MHHPGAGGFWDAIEAMGGRRLTPGQPVEALEEAIQIMREIWATDRPGGVRAGGTYYQVKGAKRGPRPAHAIGIWVGAYKPRILNMTGRVADGWLPTLAYLEGGVADLEDMNTHIEGASPAQAFDGWRETDHLWLSACRLHSLLEITL